ncbi:sugar phosphate isomerase/epimerase family protein [Sagittula sp. SSi028]|uniref:sugar phosphate isomerase/epimerase family protein n=1 Tax=Sagittula sp. SSi028 TaxID=3400636 RepID=UPI003AF8F0A5
MTPLKIGAALDVAQIATHRDWLFDAARDIEVQDFLRPTALTTDFADLVAGAQAALQGHTGRRGIHGPFYGLDMDNPDPELRPLITTRYLRGIEAADRIGARQMVLHSPYDRWFHNNRLAHAGYAEEMLARIHAILGPVVREAEVMGVTLVVENILDVDPAVRRLLVDSFGSDAIALSVDTGHAHLAHRQSGAPPVDYFLRDAGAQLAHVHLQDLDGHADRHWPPGEGEIAWPAVFRALAECKSTPHLVLELADHNMVPQGFGHLRDLGLVC